jgi:glutathione S-transferase
MTTMKLYMHPVSTTSRPVMLFAKLANVPLDLVVIDLMKGEHHGPDFVRLNPNKLVPVLDDDGFVLTESSAIIKYLADKANSPLYPKELRERARVHERMDWFNTDFYRDWGYNLAYPQLFPHHARPSADVTKATIEWGRGRAANALTLLDQQILGDKPFVCGDSMTIADIFGAQLISLGEILRVDFAKYPNVQRWLGRMKALPAWKEINAAHDGYAAAMAEKQLVAL